MEVKREDRHTVSEIEALPEEARAELIDGTIYNMSAPTATHQDIVGGLFNSLYSHIKNSNGNCKAYVSPYAVYLNNDDYNYVLPDVVVVCDKTKLDDKGCHGSPDFIAEIVSPSSRNMDYLIKFNAYQKAGVREYWQIDTDTGTVHVYEFPQEKMGVYTFRDEIPVGIYGDLKVKIEDYL